MRCRRLAILGCLVAAWLRLGWHLRRVGRGSDVSHGHDGFQECADFQRWGCREIGSLTESFPMLAVGCRRMPGGRRELRRLGFWEEIDEDSAASCVP